MTVQVVARRWSASEAEKVDEMIVADREARASAPSDVDDTIELPEDDLDADAAAEVVQVEGPEPTSRLGFSGVGRRPTDTQLKRLVWQPNWRAVRVSQDRLLGEGFIDVAIVEGILSLEERLPTPEGKRR